MPDTNFSSITNLTSYLKKDRLSSPNRFVIKFIRPPRIPIGENFREYSEILSKTAFLGNIPALQVLTETITLYGGTPEYLIPKKRKNEQLDIAFYVTDSFIQKNFFEAWINAISDLKTNNVSYYNDITGDIKILMFSQTGEINYDIDFFNVFPTIISPLRLTWLINDEWTEQQITLTYEYFKINKTNFTKNLNHFGVSY